MCNSIHFFPLAQFTLERQIGEVFNNQANTKAKCKEYIPNHVICAISGDNDNLLSI